MPKNLTPQELVEKAKHLDGEASPGPWYWNSSDEEVQSVTLPNREYPDSVASLGAHNDGRFIAEVRNLIPALIEALESTLKENEDLTHDAKKLFQEVTRLDVENQKFRKVLEKIANYACPCECSSGVTLHHEEDAVRLSGFAKEALKNQEVEK